MKNNDKDVSHNKIVKNIDNMGLETRALCHMQPCYLPSQFPHEILQWSFTNPGVVPQKPVAANGTSQQFGHAGF